METARKNENFGKSLTSGFSSLVGSKGKTYFIIEYKDGGAKHQRGASNEIIVDYAELGRDPKCQIRFDQKHPQVSRRHAAITKDGNTWVLKNLSKTNPTLINGKPVAKQWYLNNGDEIQLAYEGPRLGFLVPQNNTVGTLGLSKRMSLFRQQALRPYKQAITLISIIFGLLVIGLGAYVFLQSQKIEQQQLEMATLAERAENYEGNVDSLRREIANSAEAQQELKNRIRGLQTAVERNRQQQTEQNQQRQEEEVAPTNQNTTSQAPEGVLSMEGLFSSVYFIVAEKVTIKFRGETETVTDYKWFGTGFITKDKKFITARHVIQSWFYISDGDEIGAALNLVASNGGEIIVKFVAYGPGGEKLNFTNNDFKFDTSKDQPQTITDDRGNSYIITQAPFGGTDWAYTNVSNAGNIKTNTSESSALAQQSQLHVLGYPLGLGATNLQAPSPIYGNCIVSSNGVSPEGVIYVTDRNFEQGNSGGPVFIIKDNSYQAIGIVSAGAGGSTGFIVPLSALN